MLRVLLCIAGTCLVSFAMDHPQTEAKTVLWTGWFSDSTCASARAAAGTFTATNPECARTCIQKGAAGVFISEQAKAVFTVTGYSSLLEDLGYHVEIQARLDESAKSLKILSLKRLAEDGAACGRPKKAATKR